MPHQVIEDECKRAGALQQRSHAPEIRACRTRARLAIRNGVAGGDGQQKDTVQIRVNGWFGKGNVEEAREKRPSQQHRDADRRVVDARDGRDQPQRQLLDLLQVAFVRRGSARLNAHVERKRLVTRCANFDPMRTAFHVQLLEDAIEVVHDADVISVDIYRRFPRLDLQMDGALFRRARAVALRITEAAAISAVAAAPVPRIIVRVVARIVEPAVIATKTDAAVTPRIVPAEVAAGNVDVATRNGRWTMSWDGFANRRLAIARTTVRGHRIACLSGSRISAIRRAVAAVVSGASRHAAIIPAARHCSPCTRTSRARRTRRATHRRAPAAAGASCSRAAAIAAHSRATTTARDMASATAARDVATTTAAATRDMPAATTGAC